MNAVARELELVLDKYGAALRQLDHEKVGIKSSPAKWSKKEILGHLIDSAQNNLRRFIVAQYEENPLIVYRQDDWVRINQYQQASLSDLITLWQLLNRQIVSVLENLNSADAEKKCNTGTDHSIQWLAVDYIKHLKHHLHQILDLNEIAYP